jgi:membrane-associated HD superfamily phosphohydrolase
MRKLLFAFVVVGLSSTKLMAQYNMPIQTYVPSNVYIPAGIDYNNLNEEAPDRTKKSTAPATSVNLRFTPNAAQRRQNLAAFVAEFAKLSPGTAAQLSQLLEKKDIFGQYGKIMKTLDLDPNNVADNFAVWWIQAWEASTGRSVDTPRAAFAKVQAQVKTMFSNNTVAAMSNTDKQKMSDLMIIRIILISRQIEQSKENPEYARQLATAIKKSTKASGMDLDKMTLTEAGFVSVKSGSSK